MCAAPITSSAAEDRHVAMMHNTFSFKFFLGELQCPLWLRGESDQDCWLREALSFA